MNYPGQGELWKRIERAVQAKRRLGGVAMATHSLYRDVAWEDMENACYEHIRQARESEVASLDMVIELCELILKHEHEAVK